MSRQFVFSVDEFYHVYNRGTEKRNIFINKRDYERFVFLLYIVNQDKPIVVSELSRKNIVITHTKLVDIVSYCLMPNHFHLLIHEREEGGISKFMQKLSTAYTMYFNKRNSRSGALFQGKFKATHVGEDRYLQYLISYIHLNPVALIDPSWKESRITDKKRAIKYLQKYKYSSYLDYIGNKRPENNILTKSALPEYFDVGNNFESYVTEWLNYNI